MDMGIYMDMKCTILRFYINNEELLGTIWEHKREIKNEMERERFMLVLASFFKVHEL